LFPAKVSVPVPVLVSEPPVPPLSPPSCRTPAKVVVRLLPPTARFKELNAIVPAPSIDPIVMPAFERKDISTVPAAAFMRRAVPPVAASKKMI
jgi:hypothetical protein